MKKSNSTTRKTIRRKPLEEPKVITYERDELAADKPAVICRVSADSDRNLKKNFRPVNSKKIAKKLAAFEKPEVVTYERDELTADRAFTAQRISEVPSDRNLKKNFKPVNAKRIVKKLASFEKPEVVTYERDELVEKTTLTGTDTSGRTVSDRNLKRNFRSVRARKILARLA
jgi:hypothetical protein